MADDWKCEFCHGQSGKARASTNSRRCESNRKPWACRDALKLARQAEKDEKEKQSPMKRGRCAMQAQSGAYAAIIATKKCFNITEVYGVCFFHLDSITEDDSQLRNGIHEDDAAHHYLVRGMFGDHKQDALIPGTRWVLLRELFECCRATNLEKLTAFDDALAQEMKQAKEELVQQMQEAAVEAAEGD